MVNTRWLAVLAAVGAGLLYRRLRGRPRETPEGQVRDTTMPSARVYDLFSAVAVEPVLARVAREVAAMYPTGHLLDAGCGPGRLAVRIARECPGLEVVGLDIDPEMIALARRRAESSGVADRVRFEVGDAAAMPFLDGQFGFVVSTFSLHHWARPRAGLDEVHRVLRAGGQACIYDVAGWILRAMFHGTEGSELSPRVLEEIFGAPPEQQGWSVGPVPVVARLCVRRTPIPRQVSAAAPSGSP